jgi:hypothetical protein
MGNAIKKIRDDSQLHMDRENRIIPIRDSKKDQDLPCIDPVEVLNSVPGDSTTMIGKYK